MPLPVIRVRSIAAKLYERCDLFSIVLTAAALCLFIVGLVRSSQRQERAEDFLRQARAWAVEKYPLEHKASPWGGAYQEDFIEPLGRKLSISGLAPAPGTRFDAREQEALRSAWGERPIAHAELTFHFNGLPVLVLSR